MCDNMCEVLSSWKVQLNLVVWSFSWRSLTEACSFCMTNHNYWNSSPPDQNKELTISHIVNINYLMKLVLWESRPPYKNTFIRIFQCSWYWFLVRNQNMVRNNPWIWFQSFCISEGLFCGFTYGHFTAVGWNVHLT